MKHSEQLSIFAILVFQGCTIQYVRSEVPEYDYEQYHDALVGKVSDDEYYEEVVTSAPEFLSLATELVVDAGDSFHLPCFVSSMEEYVLMWMKNEEFISVGNQILNSQGGKYDLEISAKGNSLVVNDASPSDRGTYHCQVSSYNLASLQHMVSVRVQPVLQTVPSGTVSLKEGDSLTLNCYLSAGDPYPDVWWMIRNAEEDTDHLEKELELANVTRSHTGDYICLADNGFGVKEVSSEVSVLVEFAPEIEMEQVYLQSTTGSHIYISCNVQSSPKARVTWTKDGQNIISSDSDLYSQSVDGDTHNLILLKLTNEAYGDYSCEAENRLGMSHTSTHVSELGCWSTHPQYLTEQDLKLVPVTGQFERNNILYGIVCKHHDGQTTNPDEFVFEGIKIPRAKNAVILESNSASGNPYVDHSDLQEGERTSHLPARVDNNEKYIQEYRADPNVHTKDISKSPLLLDSNPPLPLQKYPENRRPNEDKIDIISTESRTETIEIDIATDFIESNEIGNSLDGVEEKKNNEDDSHLSHTTLKSIIGKEKVNKLNKNKSEPNTHDADDATIHSFKTKKSVKSGDSDMEIKENESRSAIKLEVKNKNRSKLTNAPDIEIEQVYLQSTTTGLHIYISCAVQSSPEARITWTKDGQNIVSSGSDLYSETVDGDTHKLFLLTMTHETFGDYSCKAENSFGISRKSTHVSVHGCWATHQIEYLSEKDLNLVSATGLMDGSNIQYGIVCTHPFADSLDEQVPDREENKIPDNENSLILETATVSSSRSIDYGDILESNEEERSPKDMTNEVDKYEYEKDSSEFVELLHNNPTPGNYTDNVKPKEDKNGSLKLISIESSTDSTGVKIAPSTDNKNETNNFEEKNQISQTKLNLLIDGEKAEETELGTTFDESEYEANIHDADDATNQSYKTENSVKSANNDMVNKGDEERSNVKSKVKKLTVNQKMRSKVTNVPEIEIEQVYLHSTKGSSIYLSCIVQSSPEARVTWTKDGQNIVPSGSDLYSESVDGDTHNLFLLTVTNESFGDYSCKAENIFGMSRKSTHVSVEGCWSTHHTYYLSDQNIDLVSASGLLDRSTIQYGIVCTQPYVESLDYQFPDPEENKIPQIENSLTIETARVPSSPSNKYQVTSDTKEEANTIDNTVVDAKEKKNYEDNKHSSKANLKFSIDDEKTGTTWNEKSEPNIHDANDATIHAYKIENSVKPANTDMTTQGDETMSDVKLEAKKKYITSNKENGSKITNTPVIDIAQIFLKYTKGSYIYISCVVQSSPEARVTWTKDGQNIVSSDSDLYSESVDGDTHNLILLTESVGVYSCKAENSFGMSQESTHVSERGCWSTHQNEYLSEQDLNLVPTTGHVNGGIIEFGIVCTHPFVDSPDEQFSDPQEYKTDNSLMIEATPVPSSPSIEYGPISDLKEEHKSRDVHEYGKEPDNLKSLDEHSLVSDPQENKIDNSLMIEATPVPSSPSIEHGAIWDMKEEQKSRDVDEHGKEPDNFKPLDEPSLVSENKIDNSLMIEATPVPSSPHIEYGAISDLNEKQRSRDADIDESGKEPANLLQNNHPLRMYVDKEKQNEDKLHHEEHEIPPIANSPVLETVEISSSSAEYEVKVDTKEEEEEIHSLISSHEDVNNTKIVLANVLEADAFEYGKNKYIIVPDHKENKMSQIDNSPIIETTPVPSSPSFWSYIYGVISDPEQEESSIDSDTDGNNKMSDNNLGMYTDKEKQNERKNDSLEIVSPESKSVTVEILNSVVEEKEKENQEDNKQISQAALKLSIDDEQNEEEIHRTTLNITGAEVDHNESESNVHDTNDAIVSLNKIKNGTTHGIANSKAEIERDEINSNPEKISNILHNSQTDTPQPSRTDESVLTEFELTQITKPQINHTIEISPTKHEEPVNKRLALLEKYKDKTFEECKLLSDIVIENANSIKMTIRLTESDCHRDCQTTPGCLGWFVGGVGGLKSCVLYGCGGFKEISQPHTVSSRVGDCFDESADLDELYSCEFSDYSYVGGERFERIVQPNAGQLSGGKLAILLFCISVLIFIT